MTETCFRQIQSALSAGPPERGMPLFGFLEDGIVRHVLLDDTASCTSASYTPDFERLNRLCAEQFMPAGLTPLGFVHSHPGAVSRPSTADLEYADRILQANPALPRLLLPIVTLEGGFAFHPYVVSRQESRVSLEAANLRLMREELRPLDEPPRLNDEGTRPTGTPRRGLFGLRSSAPSEAPWWRSEAFARVQQAYDLERLSQSCLVVVGVGGFMAGAEDLARCGVGRIVLIDFDHVSRANLATQPVYRGDVGKAKVGVLKRRIQQINPNATVIARATRLEEVTDSDFEELAGLNEPIPPLAKALVGTTDSFDAQARVNRLSLNYSIPSLCAQMYREGRAGELTFTLPGVTASCHRCLLAPRYRAYREEGFRNDVTSDGSPISSTERLNSLAVFLTLAILHHGSGHPRWDGLADQLGRRNLLQVQMLPVSDLSLVEQTPAEKPNAPFYDGAVSWLQRPADGSGGGLPCPDCGGTGDLRKARGSFTDTRLTR